MSDDLNPYSATSTTDEPMPASEPRVALSPERRGIGITALGCAAISPLLAIFGPVLLIHGPTQVHAIPPFFGGIALLLVSMLLTLLDVWCWRPRRQRLLTITSAVVVWSFLGVLLYWLDEFQQINAD